jgi:hypothetical protein
MSREIILSSSDYPSAAHPLYYIAYFVADLRYLRSGGTLETYNAANWAQYAVAMALDATTGEYFGDFPAAAANGRYFVTIYERLGGAAATTDNILAEGEFDWLANPAVTLPDTFATDDGVFISDFAEPLTFNVFGGSSVSIMGVIDRNPPLRVTEDGHNTADDLEISIRNDATLGVTAIQIGRDTITCSGRYGGAAKAHTILSVLSGDAGIWRLRLR